MTRGSTSRAPRYGSRSVRELAATILILFVQTDPVPFYFQLVENKLVLFLLSVAMTTQPFFFFGGSREVKEKQTGPLFRGDIFKVYDCWLFKNSLSILPF